MKPLDVTNMEQAAATNSDLGTFGNPGQWNLICKAWSKQNGWMKSTKAMEILGLGVLVQVSTEIRSSTGLSTDLPVIAEALQFIPGATLKVYNGVSEIVSSKSPRARTAT
jgi:hypothetical protein